jgi:hypothetical protein
MTQTAAGANGKNARVCRRSDGVTPSSLFQGGVDRRELGVQLGAKAIHDRNDGERYARCYQAILDGGRGSFIAPKSFKRSHRSASIHNDVLK